MGAMNIHPPGRVAIIPSTGRTMRTLLLVLFLALLGCGAPLPPQLALSANARASIQVRLRTPPPPKPAVALDGAPVVEFFGIPLDDARDVVFVLDVSGSMSGTAQGRLAQLGPSEPPPEPAPAEPVDKDAQPQATANPVGPADPNAPASSPPPRVSKLEVAQEELVAALERLPTGTRLNIVFFSEGVEAVAPALVTLDEGQRTSLSAYVRSTRPLTSTALVPAMRTAMMLSAQRIVLLSDGHGNVGGHDGELLRDAREAMRGGLRIDTIGLGSHDADLLRTLAAESGGLYQSF